MQDSVKSKPSKSKSNAPFLMILIAVAMIGGSFGIIVADPEAYPALKRKCAWLAVLDGLVKPERLWPSGMLAKNVTQLPSPKVIPTGLSFIGSIRYVSQPDSTLLTFDLEAAELVTTGELNNPDRIYIDLKDTRTEQNKTQRRLAQKTIKLGGDLVSRARIALKESGVIRIVLDLNRSCEFTYEAQPNATPRLIVKLRPRAVSAFFPKQEQPRTMS